MSETPPAGDAPNGWSWKLLRGFRAGERWALAEVYRLHAAEVSWILSRGFAFQLGDRWHRFVGFRSPFDLQDALHETFRLAFEPTARHGYDGLRPYGPYLGTIARNVVLKAFRLRESLFPQSSGADDEHGALAGLSAEGASAEERLSRAQLDDLVRRFLATQSALDRQILELRFVEDLSQRDVAEKLEIGRQSVRTREMVLRQRLLEFLRREDAGPVVAQVGAALVLLATLIVLFRGAGGP